ncbi:type VII secretion target [Nocardia lijiangensis]|uniref:type VII secretion target n=1 Tax=Nocardia lijiangensis TaxID=299618 RepID=UPI000829C0BD|nr:type VII secretion target [Nocardia lijiangensis]
MPNGFDISPWPHVAAEPDAIRAYADTAAACAASVATAGSVNQAATMAAAIPVFGLIGQDFLASFAVAQANHLTSVAELAYVHGMTALTCQQAATEYQVTDGLSGSDIDAVGKA